MWALGVQVLGVGAVLPLGWSPVLHPGPALLCLGHGAQLPTGEESFPRTVTVASGPTAPRRSFLSGSSGYLLPSRTQAVAAQMSEPAAFTDLSGQKRGTGRMGTRLCREGQGRVGGCSAGRPRTVGLLRAVWPWEHGWPCSGQGSLASCGPNSDLHRAPAPWCALNSFFMENTESAQKSGGRSHTSMCPLPVGSFFTDLLC